MVYGLFGGGGVKGILLPHKGLPTEYEKGGKARISSITIEANLNEILSSHLILYFLLVLFSVPLFLFQVALICEQFVL